MKNKGGKPSDKKQTENKKLCEDAFNNGWGVLYSADKLGLNKNTVNTYFKEFREKMFENIDQDFINRQKSAKEMAVRDLDVRIIKINQKIEYIEGLIDDEPENSTWIHEWKQYTEMVTNLEQQKHALDMSPTSDTPLEVEQRKQIESTKSGKSDIK